MANEQENAQIKRYPRFARSAMPLCPAKNLQMLCAALSMGKEKYDKSCYMIYADESKIERLFFSVNQNLTCITSGQLLPQ